MKKRGRKPVDPSERKSHIVGVPLTADMYAQLSKAAALRGLKLATYIREQLLEEGQHECTD